MKCKGFEPIEPCDLLDSVEDLDNLMGEASGCFISNLIMGRGRFRPPSILRRKRFFSAAVSGHWR